MRRPTRIGMAVVALVAALAVAATGPAGAQEGPTVTVTPGAALLDWHPVTVTGSGFEARQVFVVHCAGDVCQRLASPPPAAFSAPNSWFATVGDAGTFSVRLQLPRILERGEATFDCSIVTCTVEAIAYPGFSAVATSAPLTFAATGTYQWPEATLSVTPAQDVWESRRVDIEGAGYDWWSNPVHHRVTGTASVETCRAVPSPTAADCHPLVAPTFEEAMGSADVVAVGSEVDGQIRIRRHLDLPSGPWDCARQGCTVALVQEGGNPRSNRVPISFGPEWRPYPSSADFVRAYEVVRGRRLSASARSDLVASLTSRSREGVEAILDAARAARNDAGAANAPVGEVVRLYQAFFSRPPETDGLAYWVRRIGAGVEPITVARQFGGTSEFRATYDGVSDAEVVRRAYRNALGRTASTADLAYWTGRLGQGLPRWRLLHLFSGTPELRTREAKDVALTLVAFGLAGRAPTKAELDPPSAHGPTANLLASGEIDLTP